jgi:RimJ/RimL family protein N-acetyltransferase
LVSTRPLPEPFPDVRLVPLAPEHVDSLRELVDDPETRRFTRIPEPPPEDYAAGWVERFAAGRETGEREAYAVVDGAGTFLGAGMLPVIDRQAATAEIGYIVSPGARGRGVATRALSLLTDRALELGAERVVLHIAVGNPASQRVAERCGYRLEGVLRSEYWKPGVRADTQLWSLLPSDPRPSRDLR